MEVSATKANAAENRIETGEGRSARRTVVFCKRRNLRLFTINRLVLELSARLALAGTSRITSPITEGETYLLLDWEEMQAAFKSLMESAIMKRRPVAAIRGAWLPVAFGGEQWEKGCAFVSISFAWTRSAPPFGVARNMEKDEASKDLSDLCGVVERHRGAMRLIGQQGKMVLNIYLPLLKKGPKAEESNGRFLAQWP
jgi:hypothetical protein